VFTPPIAHVEPASSGSTNGIPVFTATIAGITDVNPYFLLDFTSAHTIVWDKDCMTTGIGIYPAGSCENQPTRMELGFDGSPANITETGTFSDAQFGGYVASGSMYTSEICFGGVNCKIIDVYSGESISQNNWNFNKDGTFGIIGMGPGSFIWEGFVDPETKLSTWSIELARTSFFGDSLYDDAIVSNITFGSANDAAY